ncbi:hypothetical protein J5690_02690 [bacterium]|nr:hypothetical protein [bacterium]
MAEKSSEVNWKKDFCEKYFDKDSWDLDVLNQVDVLLKDKKGNTLLYIESKFMIVNETSHRQALAQVILTNKKQKEILSRVALIYQDGEKNDILELVDCSDNSVMYNNDFNWNAEKASLPTKDAVDRINDRIKNRVTIYQNDEIREFYSLLKKNEETIISITENNFNVVYNQWKNSVRFNEEISDEQDLINLFLVDMLNGTKYKQAVYGVFEDEQPLIREGTNLAHYHINYSGDKVDGIIYKGDRISFYYTISDSGKYAFFWKKYKRPPEKNEFLKILERSATLYSEKYRKDTGGEYTPTCFVEKQVEILNQYYDMNDFIVCDPCAGVGNLENQFGKDFKHFCYLSTLEQMDVDICRIKGFENVVQFDYLKNNEQPHWKYKGTELSINEICRRENKKLMVVMNPPYQRKVGFKYDLAIEFFIKVLDLKPDVIVYYCKTEFFLRDTVSVYADSGYKIVSHIFSNAKDTFQLSEWSVSQVIFDKNSGEIISKDSIKTDRYDFDAKKNKIEFVRTYTYDNSRPYLIKEIENRISENKFGLVIGQWCYLNSVLKISNGGKEKSNKITTNNLIWCLLSKGLSFNTHHRYFEWNYLVYRGRVEEIPQELFADAVMFSLFYKGILFTNRGQKNYIMPFTAEELGCSKNDLNVLFPEDIGTQMNLFDKDAGGPPALRQFDFREFLAQFDFSAEAHALYRAALEIFRYYHRNPEYAVDRDWNDSFYDITNAIMGKDPNDFNDLESENDTRITKVKTTKGTKGFGRNTIKYAVPGEFLPVFINFFDKRDILAQKINDELVSAGLLLWKRENIY